MLTHALTRDISSQSVKMNCSNDRLGDVVRILGYQACCHASQNVARAAGRHAGIARSVHPNRAVGLSNQSAVTLQHDNQIVIAGERPCNIQPVVLYGSD